MLVMSIGLGMPQFASSSGTIALVGTLTYVICFALGAGPVPGILVPEINPPKLRGVILPFLQLPHCSSCSESQCLLSDAGTLLGAGGCCSASARQASCLQLHCPGLS